MNNMANAREELDKATATPARRSVEDGPARTYSPQSAREIKENSQKVSFTSSRNWTTQKVEEKVLRRHESLDETKARKNHGPGRPRKSI